MAKSKDLHHFTVVGIFTDNMEGDSYQTFVHEQQAPTDNDAAGYSIAGLCEDNDWSAKEGCEKIDIVAIIDNEGTCSGDGYTTSGMTFIEETRKRLKALARSRAKA